MNALMNAAGAALTMSSREISELTGKRHDNVMRDAHAMLVELHGEGGVLRFEDTQPNPQNGQSYPVYQLPKRECLVLVAGYSTTLRARIIDRWLELESGAAPALPDLANPATLRQLLLGYTEKVLALEATIEQQAPAVAFHEAVAQADNAQPLREVAKVLGVGEGRLRDFLRKSGIYMKSAPLPLQEHVDAGRFRVVERVVDKGDFKRNYAVALVTGRGLQYLQKRLADAGVHGGH